MTKDFLINLILFQLGWFACVLGGANDHIIVGVLIAFAVIVYHFYKAVDSRHELRLVSIALLIGILYESAMVYLRLAHYQHGQIHEAIAPLWMILMWPLFATTLNLSMRWLKSMPLWSIAIIGAVSAPFAYYAGNRLGAVSYDDIALSLIVIASAWSLFLPVLVLSSKKFDGCSRESFEHGSQEHPQHV
jgi:hypothetical protein